MRRLAYAPKTWIFIRSTNQGGKIYDVSTDLVRGSVTQNLGDVSTARWELRNRYKKWLRVPHNNNTCIFLPMDLVTIWMQRIAGRPIQVFTGYLDEVPYYQSYPGNAIFSATCTLKKLAYNWFDPGLPFFIQWLQHQQGWAYDPVTGEATGTVALFGNQGGPADSGLGNLIATFMIEVAGWDPDHILMGGLPPDIVGKAAKLFERIQGKAIKNEVNINQFLSDFLSIDGWSPGEVTNQDNDVLIAPGTGAPPTSTTLKNSLGNFISSPQILTLMDKIDTVGSQQNIPTIVLAMAGFMMSNMISSYRVGPETGSPNWGYGLYALRPDGTLNTSQQTRQISSMVDPAPLVGQSIDGLNITDMLDVTNATKAICRRLNANPGPWVEGAKNNDPAAMIEWIEKAVGRPVNDIWTPSQAFTMAKQAALTKMVVTPVALPSLNVDPHTATLKDSSVQELLTPQDKQVLNNNYRQADPIISKIIVTAKTISPNLNIGPMPDLQPNEVYFTGPSSAIVALYNSLVGDPTNLYVQTNVGSQIKTMRGGLISGLPVRSNLPGNGILIGVDKSSVHADANTTPGGQGGKTTSSTGMSLPQFGIFSVDANFAANFAFPTDMLQAEYLTGDKALLNDTSCLDAVKQFVQASLRTFRSLPDGRFLAFYPDYFSATRKPYWKIPDIEMIDFGIQLNDEALATHVYVIGDTLDPTDPSNMFNTIFTRGVAAVTQTEMLGFIASGKGINPITDDDHAAAFLQRFGARPRKEDEPMVRSPVYEFLLAWQRFMIMWSQLFATNCRFTFQPEVMAGGCIEFPDHYVQMFVESVTHDFDYESGFNTTATLTAPALTKDAPQQTIRSMPGFVLAKGSINSVGANTS